MEENVLFKLWVKAISESAINKFYSLEDNENTKTFEEIHKDNIEKNLSFYDPNFNFTTEFIKGIDLIPEKIWYLYRPCAKYTKPIKSTMLLHYHSLKIINPTTLSTSEKGIQLREKNLLRRYYNCEAKSITIFYKKIKPVVMNHSVFDNAVFKFIEMGEDINYTLFNNKEYSDLIVLYFREELGYVIVDNFIPAYPIWYKGNTIVLTPILLQQINGFGNTNILQSLYSRIASTIGAILIDDEFELPEFKPENVIRGISDYETGILKDGRVKKLIPDYSQHIPRYGHGWIDSDTRFTLMSTIEVVKPKIILELGSWYGLSTRLFSNYNPNKKFQIYCIDRYENNAVYEKNIYSLSPNDKLFLNHPRYETFCANLSPSDNEDRVSRYYYDKPDMNKEKEVFVMKMDIYEGIELIKKNKIQPDVILIDFEKKKDKLMKVLNKLKSYFPLATIIGDDYVFPSVKMAIKELNFKHTYTLQGAYLIANSDKNLKEIINKIKYNKNKYRLNDIQKETLKDIDNKVLFNPFIKLPSQSSFAINEFISNNKEIGMKIIKAILESESLWDYPIPIHNPASISFFDYYFTKYNYFE